MFSIDSSALNTEAQMCTRVLIAAPLAANVNLLQCDDIGVDAAQLLDDFLQLVPTLNIPLRNRESPDSVLVRIVPVWALVDPKAQ